MKRSSTIERILLWTKPALWTAIIFITLPYAPVWRDWLTEKFSTYFIPLTVLAILVTIAIYTIIRMVKSKCRLQEYVFLLIIISAYTFSLLQIKIVIEQVHFLEYGLLAILILGALRFDSPDLGAYIISALLVSLIGVVDEFVQGNLSNRVGELRDVKINILSGLLALSWYRICLKPPEFPLRAKRTLLMVLPIIGGIIVMIGIFNSHISGFGYYISDSEIGDFYSRRSMAELAQSSDHSKFRSEILPRMKSEPYAQLLHNLEERFHSEIFVHIFRRDKHLKDGDDIVAYRENQILEKYFAGYIQGTEFKWDARKIALLKSACEDKLGEKYISPVSAHLIVSFNEKEQWIFIVILEMLICMIWIYAVLRKEQR